MLQTMTATSFQLVLIFGSVIWQAVTGINESNEWHGKWFPQPPDKATDDNPIIEYDGSLVSTDVFDHQHGIKMGIPNPECDDAQTNLKIDWDNSPINHTCFDDKGLYLPNLDVHPVLHFDHIPKYYSAPHRCMNESISYDDTIPTYGTHRPLWPRYGEYQFLPKQRWLHSVEHGAIVMLYHPCANKHEILLLKKLLKGCLYRHIITPYNLLTTDRPLALVAWGSRMEMSKIHPKLVIEFIRNAALNGPEEKHEDGQFNFGLIQDADVVSDVKDSKLCPSY